MGVRSQPWLSLSAALLVCLISGGCLRPAGEPETPLAPEQRTARDAVAAYAGGLADSLDDAAEQLHAGSLTTAVEANARLQAANLAARKSAFRPLDELLNDELGGEAWDAAKAERLFRSIAVGLRGVR